MHEKMLNMPVTFYDMFVKYVKQLCPDAVKQGMRPRNGCAKRKNGYTSHCWRRSAATNLADAGVSFINLKQHG